MADHLVAFPAPDPEIDAAATVAYVQWLLDYDRDAHEPRVLAAFDMDWNSPSEALRDITVMSVAVREGAVQICFTVDCDAGAEAPAGADPDRDNPVHVIHGQVVGSNWVLPAFAKAGLLAAG